MTRFAAIVLTAALALAAAPAGFAATVSVTDSAVVFIAGGGEANRATIYRPDPGVSFVVTDTGAPLIAGSGCATQDASTVTCPTAGITAVTFDLDDLGDTFAGQAGVPLTVSGGPGADVIEGSFWSDVLNGGDGDDRLDGSSNADTLHGEGGNDVLSGSQGLDILSGGGGDDSLAPGQGDSGELLHGGDGVDTADYWGGSVVHLSLDGVANDGMPGVEFDNVGPSGDVENLTGSNVNTIFGDVLVGNDNANVLSGGGGDDLFEGGGGDDVMLAGGEFEFGSDDYVGGPGRDTVDYSARTRSLWVDLDGMADDGEFAEFDNVGTDIEVVVGGSAADVLRGGVANETLDGRGGNDRLTGGPGADLLLGGLGDDVLVEEADADLVLGISTLEGVGSDEHQGIEQAELTSGASDDFIDTTAFLGSVVLTGGDGDDFLLAGPGADTLRGENGDDELDGGLGSDNMIGGAGTDLIDYSGRSESVTADLDSELGDDGASGEHDTIDVSAEELVGGSGHDLLRGGWFSDVLIGGPGNDELAGEGGDDVLNGGSGADRLLGGSGFDLADYFERTVGVSADLDGAADDGAPGEGDLIALDVEDLAGGAGHDLLIGNGAENFLFGRGGNDTLDGGDDSDALFGDAGDDTLFTSDFALDEAHCGDGGADQAVADWLDTLDACERVQRPAPDVATGAASGVTSMTARLSGAVNPKGNATTAYWELGPTLAYGTRTPNVSLPANAGSTTINTAVSGLTPVTTYHYRLVASNGGGTTYGLDRTFTTAAGAPPPPPPPPPPRRLCPVPKLVGQSLRIARRRITQRGCRVGKITRRPSRVVRAGIVLAQKPRWNRLLPRGTKVSLVVSSGKPRKHGARR